jgi:hypothetical protein
MERTVRQWHEFRRHEGICWLENFKGDQSFLKNCKKQLKGTDIDFGKVDYGYKIMGLSIGAFVGVAFGPFFLGTVAVLTIFYGLVGLVIYC